MSSAQLAVDTARMVLRDAATATYRFKRRRWANVASELNARCRVLARRCKMPHKATDEEREAGREAAHICLRMTRETSGTNEARLRSAWLNFKAVHGE